MARTTIVIPCYNEAARLSIERFERYLRYHHEVRLLFVNDGSTDATGELLEQLKCRHAEQVDVLQQAANRGKAEAVRQGVLRAVAGMPDYVGYWDADLATPLESIGEFEGLLDARPELELVCGARVQLLGRSIRRSRMRHYLGRAFATVASCSLRLAIYDTQCGAKLFRALPHVPRLFAEPFISRWLFDVELLARRIRLCDSDGLPPLEDVLYELPLRQWHDVQGSRVRPRDFVRAAFEMARIHIHYMSRWSARPAGDAPRPATIPYPSWNPNQGHAIDPPAEQSPNRRAA